MTQAIPVAWNNPSLEAHDSTTLRQTLASLRASIDRICPVGQIMAWPAAEASVPAGWLACDGDQYLKTQYRALFDAIGTNWNTGGETAGYFRVPDLRGRVLVGLDNLGGSDAGRLSVANTLGGTGGTQTHTLSIAEMPSHAHTRNYASLAGGSADGSAPGLDVAGTVTLSSTGGGGAHNNMQPYALLNWFIRAT